MHNTAMAVAKKKYKYTNRITAHVDPGNLNRVKAQSETTGESASGIVNEALTEYFKNQKAANKLAASKNSY
jgi:hypothetical protein